MFVIWNEGELNKYQDAPSRVSMAYYYVVVVNITNAENKRTISVRVPEALPATSARLSASCAWSQITRFLWYAATDIGCVLHSNWYKEKNSATWNCPRRRDRGSESFWLIPSRFHNLEGTAAN